MIDADGSTDPSEIPSFVRALTGGADFAKGSRLVNAMDRTRYSDLCYGYNAAAGLAITEVPSFEYERIHGESNLNTFRDGRRVLKTIFTEWRRE